MMVACPCCGYDTLDQRGDFDICDICFWEDDGADDAQLDAVSGPNHITLREARRNYLTFGANRELDREKVRPPGEDDRRLRNFALEGDTVVELGAAAKAR
jgi:hypothetical protein